MEIKVRCNEINCHSCCEETEMQLSERDLKRLEKLGYNRSDFSVREDGIYILKNVNGKCFFLKNGKCSVYKYRPLGCKLYPVVWDLERKRATLHDFCPLTNEIDKKVLKRVERILKKHIVEVFGNINI